MWGLSNKPPKPRKFQAVSTLCPGQFFWCPEAYFSHGKRPEGLRWHSGEKLWKVKLEMMFKLTSHPSTPPGMRGWLPVGQLPNFATHHLTPSRGSRGFTTSLLLYLTVNRGTILKRCFSMTCQGMVLEPLSCSWKESWKEEGPQSDGQRPELKQAVF